MDKSLSLKRPEDLADFLFREYQSFNAIRSDIPEEPLFWNITKMI